MVPVRLFGDPAIGVDKANEHVPPNHCIWAKNILEQAIKGFEDDIKGSIEAGKLADMAVLDRDILSIPAEEIKDMQVEMTIVGGKIVFRRD